MSEKKAPEWSATFQRLRAETVFTSFLICAIAHPDASLQKIPLLGIDFEGAVPKVPLLVFLSVLWLYFVTAWWFRYKADRLHELLDNDRIEEFLTLLQETPEILSRWQDKDTSQLVYPLNEAVEKLGKEIRQVPDATRIEHTLRKFSAAAEPELNEMRYNDQNAVFSGELKDLADSLNRIDGAVEDRVEKLSVEIRSLTKEIADAKEAGPLGLKKLEDSAQKIAEELQSIKSSTVWERIGMGFWIPFGGTFLLIFIAFLLFSEILHIESDAAGAARWCALALLDTIERLAPLAEAVRAIQRVTPF